MNLSFPHKLTKNLQLTVDWLSEFTNMNLTIGGGTVLQARWDHRESTDIDLFYDVANEKEFYKKDAREKWFDFLAEQQKREVISDWFHLRDGDSWVTEFGPVSLYRTHKYFDEFGVPEDKEKTTGVLCDTTSDILFKKIKGRTLMRHSYIVRDMYDVACAWVLEHTHWQQVLNALDPDEHTSLKYDFDYRFMKIEDFENLRKARYESFIQSTEMLETIVGQILTNDIDIETLSVLEKAREGTGSGYSP